MAIRNRIKELRQVRAGDLAVDERNWRRHPESQTQAVLTMLNRIGWADAVIARETPDGLTLVDGHLRASLSPDDLVPVLVVDLNKEEAGEVLATLDPLAAMAEIDVEALDTLLDGIDVDMDIDLGEVVADVRDYADIDIVGLGDSDTVEPPVPNPTYQPRDHEQSGDEFDAEAGPPDVEPISKRGDIYQLGRHRLMCGDSTDAGGVARLLDGATPQCILTDPPYSSGGFQEAGRSGGSVGRRAEYAPITNDRLSLLAATPH